MPHWFISQGAPVDLELLRSLNIGRRGAPTLVASGQTAVTDDQLAGQADRLAGQADQLAGQADKMAAVSTRSKRSLGDFAAKSRLVAGIFSLNTSERCEDILLCDLLLREKEEEAGHHRAEALTDLVDGCERIARLRAAPHMDCQWLMSA
jgi:hypothetical protein